MAHYRKFSKLRNSKGGCIPSKNKFKTQINNKLRWLASDLNFKLLHTGCPVTLAGTSLTVQFPELGPTRIKLERAIQFYSGNCKS